MTSEGITENPLQVIQWLTQKTLLESLFENRNRIEKWEKYKQDHQALLKNLPEYRKSLKVEVMVPMGSKALMPGRLVHTNELMISVGDGWFIKQSVEQSIEVCNRRIKKCDEFLEKLHKEKELFENKLHYSASQSIFPNENVKEITELVDEEQEKEWRKKHRESVKKHVREMAHQRETVEHNPEVDDSTWKRLEELELQEELRGELSRLGIVNSDSSELDSDDLSEGSEEGEDKSKTDEITETPIAIKDTVPLHNTSPDSKLPSFNQEPSKKVSKFKSSCLTRKHR